MPYFVETKPEEPAEEEYQLEIDECADDIYIEEGYGVWIGRYLYWLERKLSEALEEDFNFSDYSMLSDEVFEEIENNMLRNKAKRFTNEFYPEWKDYHVTVPDYDDIVRTVEDHYCGECEAPWRDIENEEGEVVDREWEGCPDRCDGFYEDVDDSMRDAVSCDTSWLDEKWEDEIAYPLDRVYAGDLSKAPAGLDCCYA